MPHSYEYPRAALTVDVVVYALDSEDLQVMLIERDLPPFEGGWALPGGFLRVDETLEEGARRELEEETGLKGFFLEQFHAYSGLDRDPRERVVTVAFFALVNLQGHDVRPSTDARNAAWFSINDLPELAFDHRQILDDAYRQLQTKVRQQPIGFELLPAKFTLRQIQTLYEIVLDRELDKRNFRKKILSMGILKQTSEFEKDVSHRAARLYRFDRRAYGRLAKRGFHFEL